MKSKTILSTITDLYFRFRLRFDHRRNVWREELRMAKIQYSLRSSLRILWLIVFCCLRNRARFCSQYTRLSQRLLINGQAGWRWAIWWFVVLSTKTRTFSRRGRSALGSNHGKWHCSSAKWDEILLDVMLATFRYEITQLYLDESPASKQPALIVGHANTSKNIRRYEWFLWLPKHSFAAIVLTFPA